MVQRLFEVSPYTDWCDEQYLCSSAKRSLVLIYSGSFANGTLVDTVRDKVCGEVGDMSHIIEILASPRIHVRSHVESPRDSRFHSQRCLLHPSLEFGPNIGP